MKKRNLAKLALITALSTSVFLGHFNGALAAIDDSKAGIKNEKKKMKSRN